MSLTPKEREIADEVILETFNNADIEPEALRKLIKESLDFVSELDYPTPELTSKYGQIYTLLKYLEHAVKEL